MSSAFTNQFQFSAEGHVRPAIEGLDIRAAFFGSSQWLPHIGGETSEPGF